MSALDGRVRAEPIDIANVAIATYNSPEKQHPPRKSRETV